MVNFTIILLLRLAVGDLVPFMYIFFMICSVMFSTYFYKINFFTHRDERDGSITKYGIDPWMKFPREVRFDPKINADAKHLGTVGEIPFVFISIYPLLGGFFFLSGTIAQACLVPCFFLLRIWYEVRIDRVMKDKYGSDFMPYFSFYGAMYVWVFELSYSFLKTFTNTHTHTNNIVG